MKSSRYRAMRICAMPIDLINSVLGTELESGDAWLSAAAHRHIAEDHPQDYEVCLPLLGDVISGPTWIGQAHYHGGNFEVIARKTSSIGIILVALSLMPNDYGNYNVRSAYRIEQKDVDAKRSAGRIFPVI